METVETVETPPSDLLALSPSRAADFKACPQLFKFRAIDRLPEPSDPARGRGTLVHAVLERLCRLPAPERTIDAARLLLDEVWAALKGEELAGLELAEGKESSWLAEADRMVCNYFRLEDPARISVQDVEIWVTYEGERVTLRGVVDRIEVGDDGEWVLVDYKTGRPPSEQRALGSFFGLQFYALVCWRAFGKMPRELRLIQLGEPEVLTLRPTRQMLEGMERQLDALGVAILKARANDDWRPRPGWLCPHCPHQAICPAHVRGSSSPPERSGGG